MRTLHALRRLMARMSGQMAPRPHRELLEGRPLSCTDPATPPGFGASQADREPLDGVCSREVSPCVSRHSPGRKCIKGCKETLADQP